MSLQTKSCTPWATDASLVDALAAPGDQAKTFASKRLGVILDAYTVYHDLVLADSNGAIVANGRPKMFHSVGRQQAQAPWYSQAMATTSGDEYGFQTAHDSDLVDQKATLIYSCGVREGGESHGRILGALGILFDWDGLANPILENIPVRASEKATTQAHIINASGLILASNRPSKVGTNIELPQLPQIRSEAKGFFVTEIDGQSVCVGHARAPGFETYSTGWYSIVQQTLDASS
jgi:C4-dicarboxylate-specific signal transduction histidine kinase